jgi:hypothetical protein
LQEALTKKDEEIAKLQKQHTETLKTIEANQNQLKMALAEKEKQLKEKTSQ